MQSYKQWAEGGGNPGQPNPYKNKKTIYLSSAHVPCRPHAGGGMELSPLPFAERVSPPL